MEEWRVVAGDGLRSDEPRHRPKRLGLTDAVRPAEVRVRERDASRPRLDDIIIIPVVSIGRSWVWISTA